MLWSTVSLRDARHLAEQLQQGPGAGECQLRHRRRFGRFVEMAKLEG